MNFRRAGKFANSPCTSTCVPTGSPAGLIRGGSPGRTCRWVPTAALGCRLRRSSRATAATLASASPRNPSVPMSVSSLGSRSLLVACRVTASSRSSGWIPRPLSRTAISVSPPSSSSTSTRVDPASIALSTSSLTTDAGRSTTSPAAI